MENELDRLYDTCLSNTVEENAETSIIDGRDTTLQYSQTYNVRLPKPEDKIMLNTSEIKTIKEICKEAEDERFSLSELYLGIATLLLGALISALISQVHYEYNLLSIFLYTICPTGGIGFGVAYFFSRKKDINDVKQFAKRIENCISIYDENCEVRN